MISDGVHFDKYYGVAEIKKYLSRGKVDVYISYENLAESEAELKYNHDLASKYAAFVKEISEEFGLENGRGIDLIRWGFFYDNDRLAQIAAHSRYIFEKYNSADPNQKPVTTANLTAKGSGGDLECTDDSYTTYFRQGHEYFPIYQGTRNENPKLTGNSANTNTPNTPTWRIHPVVD